MLLLPTVSRMSMGFHVGFIYNWLHLYYQLPYINPESLGNAGTFGSTLLLKYDETY